MVAADFGRIVKVDAGTLQVTITLPLISAATLTGLTTVAGVKAPSGLVSDTLTMAAHAGSVFVSEGNVICLNAPGVSVTLIAGGTLPSGGPLARPGR